MSMTKQTEENSVKRDYKSRMFTMIFKDKICESFWKEIVRRRER